MSCSIFKQRYDVGTCLMFVDTPTCLMYGSSHSMGNLEFHTYSLEPATEDQVTS